MQASLVPRISLVPHNNNSMYVTRSKVVSGIIVQRGTLGTRVGNMALCDNYCVLKIIFTHSVFFLAHGVKITISACVNIYAR